MVHRAVIQQEEVDLISYEITTALISEGLLMDFGLTDKIGATAYYLVVPPHTLDTVRERVTALMPAGRV
jgi:hypothetical protein